MGKYFSDVVDQAIEDIYYCYDNTRAEAAKNALTQAAEAGDGDACYFLSRCFSGECYHWRYHPFAEDDRAAYEFLHRGVSLGSAAAVLGALRRGMLTPEMRERMPFASFREAWEQIYEKAEDGCAFCQMMISNTYYYMDILELDGVRRDDFDSQDAWKNWRREQRLKSIPWAWRAFEGGMGIAGRNLYSVYRDGEEDLMGPDPQKWEELMHRGLELGYPDWMYQWAFELYYGRKQKQEGLSWALEAAHRGHLSGWAIVGDAYRYGSAGKTDLPYALECYEKTAAHGNDGYACARLGEMYFCGLGTAQNYARAVQYLEEACRLDRGMPRHQDILGICHLLGYGCRQVVIKGRTLLMFSGDSQYKHYGLGRMYAEGIGVAEDIGKGVKHLQAAGDYAPAVEALKQYKKSIFGVWRRR